MILEMANNTNDLETLKIKLISATKLKISKDKELCQALNREHSLKEELTTLNSEIEFLKEQLEETKTQIAQTLHHLSMIGICTISEKCKTDAHVANLNRHQGGFQEFFNKERKLFELRMKEIKEKEIAQEDEIRQQEKKVAEKKEQRDREAATVEVESVALEKECVVLKRDGSDKLQTKIPLSKMSFEYEEKRNNAIMLKLRRKLLETEKSRRVLAKKNADKNAN